MRNVNFTFLIQVRNAELSFEVIADSLIDEQGSLFKVSLISWMASKARAIVSCDFPIFVSQKIHEKYNILLVTVR